MVYKCSQSAPPLVAAAAAAAGVVEGRFLLPPLVRQSPARCGGDHNTVGLCDRRRRRRRRPHRRGGSAAGTYGRASNSRDWDEQNGEEQEQEGEGFRSGEEQDQVRVVQRSSMASSLFHAVRTCRFHRVKVLLDQGLRPTIRDDAGRNLLMACLEIAEDDRRQRMFSYLLRRGCDPHHVDTTSGRDVLTWAVCRDRITQVKQLLAATVGDLDLQLKDKDGYTALHHAIFVGNCDIVRTLVTALQRYQLSVDVHDGSGMTPYIHAKRLGHHEIGETLVREGQASPRQADKHGFRDAETWARKGLEERRLRVQQLRTEEEIRRKISGRFPPVDKRQSGARISGNGRTHAWTNGTNNNNTNGIRGNNAAAGKTGGRIYCGAGSGGVDDTDARAGGALPRQVVSESGSPVATTNALGLMRNTELLGGDSATLVTDFKSSEFDQSKQGEYKTIGVDVTTLMDSLSAQQSSSYRKTVIPQPVRPRTVKVEAPKKDKVSTLAILMGKGQKKGTTRKKKQNEARPGKNKGDTKRKNKTQFPPIRAK